MPYLCICSCFAYTQLQVPFNRTVDSERKTKTWREHMVFHHFYLRCYHPFSLAMTLLPVHDLLISTLKVLFESDAVMHSQSGREGDTADSFIEGVGRRERIHHVPRRRAPAFLDKG